MDMTDYCFLTPISDGAGFQLTITIITSCYLNVIGILTMV